MYNISCLPVGAWQQRFLSPIQLASPSYCNHRSLCCFAHLNQDLILFSFFFNLIKSLIDQDLILFFKFRFKKKSPIQLASQSYCSPRSLCCFAHLNQDLDLIAPLAQGEISLCVKVLSCNLGSYDQESKYCPQGHIKLFCQKPPPPI